MKLTPEERETIILFDEASEEASVYTHNVILKNRLSELHRKFPKLVYPKRKEHPGAVCYTIPKRLIHLRTPKSIE